MQIMGFIFNYFYSLKLLNYADNVIQLYLNILFGIYMSLCFYFANLLCFVWCRPHPA